MTIRYKTQMPAMLSCATKVHKPRQARKGATVVIASGCTAEHLETPNVPYIVLARKYRPSSLAEIIGQEAIVQTLRNAIKLGRIHHAYLLTGARGVGKTSIARILAKSLNCIQGASDEPCGKCASCLEIAQSSSPDVLEIDGASNTSVDDVRSLRETVHYAPVGGKYKIYIIDEVHMLSTSAFNALLKTLEEPPPHVMFIFATTEPHKIPITILSRCQRFDFRRVSIKTLSAHLQQVTQKEGLHFSDDAVRTIAHAADGSVRDAMSLLDQVLAFAGNQATAEQVQQALGLLDHQKIHALLLALLSRNRTQVSQLVQEAYGSGVDLTEIGERLLEVIRDLTLAKLSHDKINSLSELTGGEITSLLENAKQLSITDLHRLFETVMTAVNETSRSPYPNLSLEMGLMRACDLEPVIALADMIAQLHGDASKEPLSSPTSTSLISNPSITVAKTTTTEPLDFRQLQRKILATKPRLGMALEHVICVELSSTQLVLSVAKDQEMFAEILRDNDSKRELTELLATLVGHPLALVIRTNESSPNTSQTLAEEREISQREESSRLKHQALQHEAVLKTLGTLGGEVHRVNISPALSRPVEEFE